MNAFLEMGFRPLFLAAGAWAALALAVWLSALAGLWEIPSVFDATLWHAHEMIFGFAAAAIGGFLLTAIPNWTTRPPVRGWTLGLLALAWLAGRLAMMFSEIIGAPAAAVVDLLYLTALVALAAREIVAGGNPRNLPIAGVVGVIAIANALVHLEVIGGPESAAFGTRLAIVCIALLVSLIGGRIVPAFTRNWLVARESASLPAAVGRLDHATLVATLLAGLVWAVFPERAESGWLALLAGLLHLVRLGRWQGHRTLSDPLLWVLHLAYLWLAAGFLLLGGAVLWPELPLSAALHALTAGAFSTMILAVMTRASLGHAGRELRAGPGDVSAFLLVTAAALARLAAPVVSEPWVIMASGVLWIAGFGLFVVLYLPVFLSPAAKS